MAQCQPQLAEQDFCSIKIRLRSGPEKVRLSGNMIHDALRANLQQHYYFSGLQEGFGLVYQRLSVAFLRKLKAIIL